VGELGLGVQKTDYRKQVRLPGLPTAHTEDSPLLVYATAAAHLSKDWVLYAGYTRGLEESGIAPESAANRNEALPAIRTRQIDAGVRWNIGEEWRLVAGLFKVEKPYFINDENNVYTILGDVQHQGVELSLSGRVSEDLTLLAGAVLMDPQVTGPAVESGTLGRKPVGQTDRLLRINADYQLPFTGWTVDLGATYYGERVASRNGHSKTPAYTLVDMGARYRFQLAGKPASVRAQVLNLTDTFYWTIQGNNSFGMADKRRWQLSLTVDI
jgi:iron complex outermembrane receptor protein